MESAQTKIVYRTRKLVEFYGTGDKWEIDFLHDNIKFTLPIGPRPDWLHPEAVTAEMDMEIILCPLSPTTNPKTT